LNTEKKKLKMGGKESRMIMMMIIILNISFPKIEQERMRLNG
tara:strand:+ start:678 stop:803 length:126 start_codon:yes stop_codon:yes gene_type:complete